MADHLIPLQCEQLQPGMFVAELDRSWLHTPFTGRGFLITQRAQVRALQRHCRYVYVDEARSEPGLFDAAATIADVNGINGSHSDGGSNGLAPARRALDDLLGRVTWTIRIARQEGRIDLSLLEQAAAGFVQDVLQNPDIPQWLIRTGDTPGFLYRRSIGSAVFSIVFGRHLGFDVTELHHLAMGGLLLDIGKIEVPIPILAKPEQLNPVEQSFVKKHVPRGLAMLKRHAEVPDRVVDMVLGHHERLDGSGYPRRLGGTEIPLFGRMAAIVDTFDALTLNRRYAAAMSANAALHFLNSLRDIKYDAALVGEFVHALGVFPTGTSVEMVDGSVGLVCSQTTDWPLRPRVVLITDAGGEPLTEPRVMDTGVSAHIARALPPDTIPVDTRRLERTIEHQGGFVH